MPATAAAAAAATAAAAAAAATDSSAADSFAATAAPKHSSRSRRDCSRALVLVSVSYNDAVMKSHFCNTQLVPTLLFFSNRFPAPC